MKKQVKVKVEQPKVEHTKNAFGYWEGTKRDKVIQLLLKGANKEQLLTTGISKNHLQHFLSELRWRRFDLKHISYYKLEKKA